MATKFTEEELKAMEPIRDAYLAENKRELERFYKIVLSFMRIAGHGPVEKDILNVLYNHGYGRGKDEVIAEVIDRLPPIQDGDDYTHYVIQSVGSVLTKDFPIKELDDEH